MVFQWGYSHLRTFEFTFRAKMREWEVVKVKKQKGEDTRARAKLRREVAFLLSFLRLRTFSFSPSQLLPSPFYACVHVVLYRLNIMLTVKVASAAEDELWEDFSNRNCLTMKFKYYCVDTMVSRLVRTGVWKCKRIMIRIEARIKNPRLSSLSRQIRIIQQPFHKKRVLLSHYKI